MRSIGPAVAREQSPGLSGLHWAWCIGRGPHLQLRQEPQGTSDFRLRSQGPLQTGDRRVRPRLGLRHGTPLASRDVPGERGRLSSCIWNLGFFPNDARENCPLVRSESQPSSWVEAWNSACLSRCPRGERPLVELYLEPGVFSERCTGKLPLRVDFIHRLEFGEVSGHRVLIKRGPGNRGPTECGTTHEATSGMSS